MAAGEAPSSDEIVAALAREASRAADEVRRAGDAHLREVVAARVRPARQFGDPARTQRDQQRYNRELDALIEDLRRQERDGAGGSALVGVLNNAAGAAIRGILQQLSGQIDALADGQIARELAGPGDLLMAAERQATEAEHALRRHLGAALNTAEWQARRRAALEEFERSTPSRELPPGFGVPVLDGNGQRRLDGDGRVIRSYPLGHQGRFLRLGDARLSEAAEIAELIADSLPNATAP